MSAEVLGLIAVQIRAAVALDEHAHAEVLVADCAPSLRKKAVAVICLRAEDLLLIADAIDAKPKKAVRQ